MRNRERACFLLFMSIALAPVVATAEVEETLIIAAEGEIRLAPGEPGSSLEASLDGGVLRPLPMPFSGPAEGDHWLAVAGRDRAGNPSEVRWLRLRIDSEAPRVQIVLDPPPQPDGDGELWAVPWALVKAHASDDLSGVSKTVLQVGHDIAEAGAGTVTMEVPLNGRYVLRAWSEDRVGNRSAETRLVVSVADEPPRRPLDSPIDFETGTTGAAP